MHSNEMDIDQGALNRASGWLQAWDAQGTHRTGTAGDMAGADWLAEEVARLGVAPEIEAFPLARIDPVAAYVEIGSERIVGEMMFDAPDTAADGVRSRASIGDGFVAAAEPIHILTLSPHAVYSPDFARFRRTTEARVLIIVTDGGEPGLALLNAESFREPFGPPVLQVSSADGARLLAAARESVVLRVMVTSRRVTARARNVVVSVAGAERSLAPVVVMTPRSSWWQSTAERGGGIACWLESLRAVCAHPPRRDVVFTANSGHELGHIGLDDFVARRPGWDQRGGATWIHYGANIGARDGALNILSTEDDLRDLFQAELSRAGRAADLLAEKTLVPSGETRDIHKAGGRYLTLVGTNKLFHLPQDRWPDSVDVPSIARIAAGAARAVSTLSQ